MKLRMLGSFIGFVLMFTGAPHAQFPFTVQVTDALGGVDVETLTLKLR